MSDKEWVQFEDWREQRDKDATDRIRKQRSAYKKPLTANHNRYMVAIREHSITICVGPAGTGKTTLACQVAAKMLMEGKIQQIVLTRPLVECGGELGTLPGGPEEKMAFFLAPMVKALKKALGAEYEKLKRDERIVICPLEQMRGETFDDSVVIIDEPQNATYAQLHMALTRLGFGTRIVVCGDLRQPDLSRDVPLLHIVRRLERLHRKEISIHEMTKDDVLRPDIVSIIDEALAEGYDQCVLNLPSMTTTTPTSMEPALSYADMVATEARTRQSSSESSKKPASKRPRTAPSSK